MSMYFTAPLAGCAYKHKVEFIYPMERKDASTLVEWAKLNWGRPKSVCRAEDMLSSRRWGLWKNWPEKLVLYFSTDEDLLAFTLQWAAVHTCIKAEGQISWLPIKKFSFKIDGVNYGTLDSAA